MWRGQGRSFGRSADAASGGYEQWPQQTRGGPSAELAARYAMPTGFGAPAAAAMTPRRLFCRQALRSRRRHLE